MAMIEHWKQWLFCEPAGLPCAGGVCGEQGEKFPLAHHTDRLNTREADQGNGSAALLIFEGRRQPKHGEAPLSRGMAVDHISWPSGGATR